VIKKNGFIRREAVENGGNFSGFPHKAGGIYIGRGYQSEGRGKHYFSEVSDFGRRVRRNDGFDDMSSYQSVEVYQG